MHDRRRRPPSAVGRAGRARPAPRSGRAGPGRRRAPAPGTPSRWCERRTAASGWPGPHRSWRPGSGPSVCLSSRCTIPAARPRRSSRGARRAPRRDRERVHQGPGRVAVARVHHQPGRLVDDQHRRRPRRRPRAGSTRHAASDRGRADSSTLDPLTPGAAGPMRAARRPSTRARPSEMSRWACARLISATALTARSNRRVSAGPVTTRSPTVAASLTRSPRVGRGLSGRGRRRGCRCRPRPRNRRH